MAITGQNAEKGMSLWKTPTENTPGYFAGFLTRHTSPMEREVCFWEKLKMVCGNFEILSSLYLFALFNLGKNNQRKQNSTVRPPVFESVA